MIIITALWKAQPGKERELQEHLENMVDQVREHEPDCYEYILHKSLADETQFFLYEQYQDQAAVEFHKQTRHFKALLAHTDALIADEVEVKMFELIV